MQWPVPRRLTSRIIDSIQGPGRSSETLKVYARGGQIKSYSAKDGPTWGALGYRKIPKLSASKQCKWAPGNTKNLP